VGVLELQEARRTFSRVRPKCWRSLSFNREIRAYGCRRKGSSQFSHSGGTNPSRGHCAACATGTPGLKIYRDKRARPYSFDSTDGTPSRSFSTGVAALVRFAWRKFFSHSPHETCSDRHPSQKPSPTICFYLKTIRGKLDKLLWNVTCSSRPPLGSSRAFNNPRFKQTELGGPRRFAPTRLASLTNEAPRHSLESARSLCGKK
jgi:hypothetical protein